MSTPTEASRGIGVALWGTAIHGLLISVILAILYLRVPGLKHALDEYGLTLPWISTLVIRLSSVVIEFWWMIVPTVALLLFADFFFAQTLGTQSRAAQEIWVAIAILFLIAVAALILLGIELPMMKLRAALAVH